MSITELYRIIEQKERRIKSLEAQNKKVFKCIFNKGYIVLQPTNRVTKV